MAFTIETIGILLLISAFVAMLARRFNFPYTVGLLLTGVIVAFLPIVPTIPLTKELIFIALLPPLIFEAALFLHWYELKPVMTPAIVIASLGIILSALVTAIGMHYLVGWSLLSAMVFGVLIGATDPVSVIATFKDTGVKGKLKVLVESESLFNDGMAAVLFGVALAFVAGQAPTALEISFNVIKVVGGGILSGVAVGYAMLFLLGKTTDHLVELTFTTIAAYGSFILAEHFHCSGVLATLTTGLLLGNLGHLGAISPKGREVVESFWEFVAFIANSLIFILIGIYEAKNLNMSLIGASLIAVVLVMLGRAVAIYPLSALFNKTRYRIDIKHQHILVWGGLRGALALALALGLPADLAYRNEILTVTFAVVGFSIIVQGLTMTPLMRCLGLLPKLEKLN